MSKRFVIKFKELGVRYS